MNFKTRLWLLLFIFLFSVLKSIGQQTDLLNRVNTIRITENFQERSLNFLYLDFRNAEEQQELIKFFTGQKAPDSTCNSSLSRVSAVYVFNIQNVTNLDERVFIHLPLGLQGNARLFRLGNSVHSNKIDCVDNPAREYFQVFVPANSKDYYTVAFNAQPGPYPGKITFYSTDTYLAVYKAQHFQFFFLFGFLAVVGLVSLLIAIWRMESTIFYLYFLYITCLIILVLFSSNLVEFGNSATFEQSIDSLTHVSLLLLLLFIVQFLRKSKKNFIDQRIVFLYCLLGIVLLTSRVLFNGAWINFFSAGTHIWLIVGMAFLLQKLATRSLSRIVRQIFYATLVPFVIFYIILLVHIIGLADVQFSPFTGYFYLSVWGILLVGGLLIVNIRSITLETEQYKNSLIEQQKNYVSAMVEAQEIERKRLAIELHDGLGQVLSTARITLSSLEGELAEKQDKRLNSGIKLLDRAVTEIRAVSHSMMPTALVRENGLEPAIEEIVNQVNSTGKVHAEFSVNKHVVLPDYVQINIYRIVQEAVNNILKHAQATRIEIVMLFYESTAQLSISDNGSGIDIKELEAGKGMGWKNINNRVDMLKGEISFMSGKNSGSIIGIEFPIKFGTSDKIEKSGPSIPFKQGPLPDLNTEM